ncbi:hypothetical protein [Haloferax mucosum]|nr:hypothetical protein [Haloferax mucosum]
MPEKEYETPPYNVAKLGYVIEVCASVQSSAKPRESIKNDTDISKINNTITYANRLGFVDESDNEFKATESGIELSFATKENASGIFCEAIPSYDFYRDLSEVIYRRHDDLVTDSYLSRDDVEKEIQIRFELEISEYTREKVADQYLRTLDWAGLGDRIQGSSSKPTRLEFSDDLRSALKKLSSEEGTNSETPSEDDDSSEPQTPPPRTAPEKLSVTPAELGPIETNQANNVNLDIKFEIGGSDDPENVRMLMRAIREELQGGAEVENDSRESDSTETPEEPAQEPTNSLNDSEESPEVEEIGSVPAEEKEEQDGVLNDFI